MASSTTKADDKPAAAAATGAADPKLEAKAVTLGEDDEFEDFPVDGMFSHRRVRLGDG